MKILKSEMAVLIGLGTCNPATLPLRFGGHYVDIPSPLQMLLRL